MRNKAIPRGYRRVRLGENLVGRNVYVVNDDTKQIRLYLKEDGWETHETYSNPRGHHGFLFKKNSNPRG